ncbi:hypothetical protein CK203_110055 [Vitis vinifera]|uniref:Uncharacterized protein n=1 Tax=Vitis vinifera TaxID=29760 RepID=A0A438EAQ8_VITVI|nr:hypothetical protein CK203_110055 [Vitis vinifera]
MEEAKTMKTSMSSSIKLDKDEKGKSIDSTMYRGMIGDRNSRDGGRVGPSEWLSAEKAELEYLPLQTESVQFEATFSEPMLSESTFIEVSSTQPSYIEPFFGPAFTKPTHIDIPPPHAPLAPDHALWMNLSTQISSLGTRHGGACYGQ